MADYRDVLLARGAADSALATANSYKDRLEAGHESDTALALLHAADALCHELRALATVQDYTASTLRRV
jgi:hypothetical protein